MKTGEKMLPVTSLRLAESVHDEVAALAKENNRTICGQVAFMVRRDLLRIREESAREKADR
jgi:hypothetical protein